MHDTKTEAPKQYQCRHIFTDGRRCASPCLRQEEFCYYHHTTRKPVADPRQRRSRRSTFHLPLPEDRSAIQSSIGEVLQRIASNDIDPRRAGLLLYGLQIASLNLPKPPATHRNARPEPIEVVDEITTHPELGILAPRAEVSHAKRKSPVAQLIERMMQSEQEEAPKTAQPHQPAEPVIVPTLQATEDSVALGATAPSTWALFRRWDPARNGTFGATCFGYKRLGCEGRKKRQRHKTKVQLLPLTQPRKIALIARKRSAVEVDMPSLCLEPITRGSSQTASRNVDRSHVDGTRAKTWA